MLKSYDDAKGKSQSFEVWSTHFAAENITPGYGATQEEALKEFQENADRYIRELVEYNQRIIKGIPTGKKYERIDLPLGSSIGEAVAELEYHRDKGRLVSAKFNDKILYSDTVTLDGAYMEITGKTREELADER